jgi:hypothetical protein
MLRHPEWRTLTDNRSHNWHMPASEPVFPLDSDTAAELRRAATLRMKDEYHPVLCMISARQALATSTLPHVEPKAISHFRSADGQRAKLLPVTTESGTGVSASSVRQPGGALAMPSRAWLAGNATRFRTRMPPSHPITVQLC